MSYIEQNLMADESLVHVTRLHPIVLAPVLMAVSLLLGSLSLASDIPLLETVIYVLLFFAVLRLIQRVIFFLTSEYGVTTKRVLGKTGFINRRSLDIVLAKVEAVRLDQHLLGRLLNFGNLEVTGTGGTEEVLKFIPDPLAFRNCIQEQIWSLHKEGGEQARFVQS